MGPNVGHGAPTGPLGGAARSWRFDLDPPGRKVAPSQRPNPWGQNGAKPSDQVLQTV
jgi:hypothetical protein